MERLKAAFIPEVCHALYPGKLEPPVLEGERGGESIIPSPNGKKRAAPEDLEAEASKQGKKSLSGGPNSGGDIAAQCPQGGQPSDKL